MSAGKLKPRKLFMEIARRAGISAEKAASLLIEMDSAGLVVMPVEPTGVLLDASFSAMRLSRSKMPANKQAAQRVKHEVRYRAMVERQRRGLGLDDSAVDQLDSAVRAVAAICGGAALRARTPPQPAAEGVS